MRLGCIPHLLCAMAAAMLPTFPAQAAVPEKPGLVRGTTRQIAVEVREQANGKLKRFYASRGFWPIWASSGRFGPEAELLLGLLDSADLDGLSPSSYDIPELREAISRANSSDPRLIARAELALSKAFARYVADTRGRPRVGMTYLNDELRPKAPAIRSVLRAASLRASLKDYVMSMGWMSPHYVRMRTLLARARELRSSEQELERIRLNLDRARLLPAAWVRHIVVDAASARLWYYQDGKQQGTMRVVVGTVQTPTPMLAGQVRYAILNPYWNIPVDLVQAKLAPKLAAGQLPKSMRLEVLSDWSASPRKLNPATVDWAAVAAGKEVVRLRQMPGGNNAMGRVKFIFPNDDGIYLHDTPDKALFGKAGRHFSNGCIRLEDAARLGKWLLGKPLPARSKKPEQAIALPAPVPVYLTYLTATPTEDGVGFLEDVYGRDR